MPDNVKFEDCRENFYSKDGRPFLVYCPSCKRENYGPNVATGKCAWCGWSPTIKKKEADT